MSEWQTMDTAPKDDRTLILLDEGRCVDVGFWSEERQCWIKESFRGCQTKKWSYWGGVAEINPTRWQPLPEEP